MWTSVKIDTQESNGEKYVWIRRTNDTNSSYFEPAPYHMANPPAGWPDDLENAVLDSLNAPDKSTIKTGPIDPKKIPDPPTQFELDRQVFLIAMQSYIVLTNSYNAAIAAKIATKISPQDIDISFASWKAALNLHPDEFTALVPKDFIYL